MEKLLSILDSIGIPYAYDHFAEGESPEPPFLLSLIHIWKAWDSQSFPSGRALRICLHRPKN